MAIPDQCLAPPWAWLGTGTEAGRLRPVDLLDRQSIEQSRNYLRRRRILQEAEPIFVAG